MWPCCCVWQNGEDEDRENQHDKMKLAHKEPMLSKAFRWQTESVEPWFPLGPNLNLRKSELLTRGGGGVT